MVENSVTTQSNYSLVKENKAEVFLPKNVFYNPVQEFNRDMRLVTCFTFSSSFKLNTYTFVSILVVDTFLKHKLWSKGSKRVNPENFKLCEALSATGLRCIRYALELQCKDLIKQFVANDLMQGAYEMIQKNIKLNKCEANIRAENYDAR